MKYKLKDTQGQSAHCITEIYAQMFFSEECGNHILLNWIPCMKIGKMNGWELGRDESEPILSG